MDSAQVDMKLAAKLKQKAKEEEEEFHDLSSDDIGKIKRSIANILQPGETVCTFHIFFLCVDITL